MAQLSFHEEADDCRRKALTYVGRPEAPFLLKIAKAFDELSLEDDVPTADSSTKYAGRRTDRVRVDAWLFMRRAGEVKFKTCIYDISPEGCMLEVVSNPRVGDRVGIKIENMEPLEAVICWVEESRCGLRFEAPLRFEVFSSILENYDRRRNAGLVSSALPKAKAYG